jgi:glutamate synthase (NADPH/NADH) small chain
MVSLNTIMVDGTGMCGSCRVTVSGKVRFACVDGPDFDAHQVDFDELLARKGRFDAPRSRRATATTRTCASVEQTLFEEGRANYKKLRELAPTRRDARARPRRARATLRRGQPGVLAADAWRGRALHSVRRPTCIAGCPVSIDIPRFIRHLLVRDLDGALEVIHEANILPSVCGRVCPQESQCEAQCDRPQEAGAVGIGRLERFVGDHARAAAVATAPRRSARARHAWPSSAPGPRGWRARRPRAGWRGRDRHSRRCTSSAACSATASRRSACRATSSTARSRAWRDLGVPSRRTRSSAARSPCTQLLRASRGFDAVFLGVGAGAPSFLGIPGEFAGQVIRPTSSSHA